MTELLRVSRPRFWIYTFGPFIVGIAAAATSATDLYQPWLGLLAVYFLFPANLLIYGVNDACDMDTDLVNDKKTGYELPLEATRRWRTVLAAAVVNLPFLPVTAILTPNALVPLIIFQLLSVFYSAPPIRAKSKPFLDSAFNFLYVMPAVCSYSAITGETPDAQLLIAAGFWTAAMHAYSATPDIQADSQAGIRTIATFLGARWTLVACGVFFLASATLSFKYLGLLSVILGAAYLLLIIYSLRLLASASLMNLYRLFPLINSLAGFAIFWYVLLVR